MDVNYLLHLPEELVEDSADDVHDRLVQLYSPVEDQESEEEGVEELPRVQPRQALLLLQQLRLYEEQKSMPNTGWISNLYSYEKVVRKEQTEGLKQQSLDKYFVVSRDHSI
ncbi:hypothetical protein K3495_g4159 [Podosphaera aphanis]|nr:hypothetical protein K3495_g4159 [Podosphaera aphanis]